MDVDKQGLTALTDNIRDEVIEGYLLDFSKSVDEKLLKEIKNSFIKHIILFLTKFDKEAKELKELLKENDTYNHYSKGFNPKNIAEQIPIAFREARQCSDEELLERDVLAIIWKNYFIALFVKGLLEELKGLDIKGGRIIKLERNKKTGRLEEIKNQSFYTPDVLVGIIKKWYVIDKEIKEYFELKERILLELKNEKTDETENQMSFYREMNNLGLRVNEGDYSVIYQIKPILYLFFQSKLRYLDNPLILKNWKKFTLIDVLDSCEKIGIKLSVKKDLILKLIEICDESIGTGKEIPISHIWYISTFFSAMFQELESVKVSNEEKEKLQQELITKFSLG